MKLYGLVIKGTRELVRVEVRNGCDEGEITYGPVYTLSLESHLPHWLVGNYDMALDMTRPVPKGTYRKAWMFDNYDKPDNEYVVRDNQLEVVEVTLLIK